MLSEKQINDVFNLLDSFGKEGVLFSALGGPEGLLESRLGLKWKDYAKPGQKMREWLIESIPRLGYDEMRVFASKWHALAKALTEKVNEDGVIPLPMVNTTLKDMGYGDWKDYCQEGENKIYLWVRRQLGHWFTVENVDKDWVLRPIKKSAPASSDYPLDLDPTSPEALEEVKAMHGYAFMGSWTALGRTLFNLTGAGGPRAEYWRAIVAHKIAQAQVYLLDRSAIGPDGAERKVIDLNLKTKDGKDLYLVLEKNDPSGRQNWKLHEICYPGEPGTGLWLCTALGLPSQNVREIKELRAAVSSLLPQLEESARNAHEAADSLSAQADAVVCPDENDFAALEKYNELWTQMNDLLERLAYEGDHSLTSIRRWIDQGGVANVLERSLKALRDAICFTAEQLERLHLLPEDDSDDSPARKDLQILDEWHEALKQSGDILPDPEPIFSLLACYRRLAHINGVNHLTDADDAALMEIARHLALKPARVNMYFVGEKSLADKESSLADLEGQLRGLLNEKSDKIRRNQPTGLPQDRLSDVIERVFSKSVSDNEEIYHAFREPNDLERSLIDCNTERAVKLLRDESAMAEMGYAKDEASTILDRMEDDKAAKLSKVMRPLACGNRLYYAQGNIHHQAEKYWLGALIRPQSDAEEHETYESLLTLFRHEERADDFLCVYSHAPENLLISPENYHYLLQCYADHGEYEKDVQIFQKKPELLYQEFDEEKNIDIALYAAHQCKDEAFIKQCTEIQARLSKMSEGEEAVGPDALEQAVIDLGAEKESAELLERLLDEAENQDDPRIQGAREVLRAEEYSTQTTTFDKGLRLYQFFRGQGGTNAVLAEKLMWQGVRLDQMCHQMGDGLFPLLQEQGRAAEIVMIYDAYEKVLRQQENCRTYYLTALCKVDGARAAQFACLHLADMLQLYIEAGRFDDRKALFEDALRKNAPNLHELLERMKSEALAHEYVRCVLLDAPELRNFILHPALLDEFKMSASLIERLTGQYKSSQYPSEQRPDRMALRAYIFLENRFGLAEDLAKFAQSLVASDESEENKKITQDVAHLLLRILWDEQDADKQRWDRIAALFKHYPDLVQREQGRYLQTLIHTNQHEAWLAVPQDVRLAKGGSLAVSFDRLAVLATNESLTSEERVRLTKFDPIHIKTLPSQFHDLSERMVQRQDMSAFSALLLNVFPTALIYDDEDGLREMVTARGLLSFDALADLQREWVALPEGRELALYLSNVLQIGELQALSDAYYQEKLNTIDHLEGSQKKEELNRLERLYPDRGQELCSRYLEDSFSEIWDERDGSVRIAELQAWLKENDLNRDALETLLNHLQKDKDLLQDVRLLRVLIDNTAPQDSPFLAAWLSTVQGTPSEPLVNLYLCLLAEQSPEQSLPEQALPAVTAQCEQALLLHNTPTVVSCLWMLYRRTGDVLAESFAASALAGYASAEYPASVHTLFDAAEKPELANAFLQTLRGVPTDELENFEKKYRTLARELLTISAEDQQTATRYVDLQALCAPDESVRLLRVFLCAEGEDAKKTARLLLNVPTEDESIRSKLDAMASSAELFISLRECAQALTDARNLPEITKAQKKTMRVLNQMDDQTTLSQELIRQTADAFCGELDVAQEINNGLFKTLNNLSIFAVKTGCAEYVLQKDAVRNCYCADANLVCTGLFAVRLLLDGKISLARPLLERLYESVAPLDYQPLYAKLAEMEDSALAEYTASPKGRLLLETALPDGRQPSYENVVLPKLIAPVLQSDDPQLHLMHAQIIVELMEMFPADNSLDFALYLCCKGNVEFEGRLLYLYRAELAMSLHKENKFMAREITAQQSDAILLGCFLNRIGLGNQAWRGKPDKALYQRLLNTDRGEDAARVANEFDHWKLFLEGEKPERAKALVIARLTGEWTDFVSNLFETDGRPAQYKDWLRGTVPYAPGLLRSLVRIYYARPKDQRDYYIKWMTKWMDLRKVGDKSLESLASVFKDAKVLLRDLRKNWNEEKIRDFLTLPLEERALDRFLYSKINEEYDNDFNMVLSLSVCQQNLSTALYLADKACENANDRDAAIYYKIIGNSVRIFGLAMPVSMRFSKMTPEQAERNQTQELRTREFLSALMSNMKPEILSAAKSETRSSRRKALGAMIELLALKREKELPVFLSKFNPSVQKFLLQICRMLEYQNTNTRLEIAKEMQDSYNRGLAICVLKRLSPEDSTIVDEYSAILRQLSLESGKEFRLYIFLPGRYRSVVNRIPPYSDLLESLGRQEDAAQKANAAQSAFTGGELISPAPFLEPSYASLISDELLPKDMALDPLPKLKSEYFQNIAELRNVGNDWGKKKELHQRQRRLSAQRYRRACRTDQETARICLALGTDEINCILDGVGLTSLEDTLFEAVQVSASCRRTDSEWQELSNLAPNVLHRLLLASTDLSRLIELYAKNKEAFDTIGKMMKGEMVSGFGQMIKNLDELCRAYEQTKADEDMRITALENIWNEYNEGERTSMWYKPCARMETLLLDELNKLKDFPRLTPKQFNHEVVSRGSLFGEVRNIGSQSATDVVLHATVGSMSYEYRLNRLRPGSSAPYNIRLQEDMEVGTNLTMTLSLSYHFKNKPLNSETIRENLCVVSAQEPNLPISPYPTQAVMDYEMDSDGNVISSMLFGRDYEKSQLRALVTGPFSNYRDVFVRGVRRAGKTSLLNYLQYYIKHCCTKENVLPLYITCQSFTDNRLVQSIFIDHVIDAVQTSEPTLTVTEAWSELRDRWTLAPGKPDRSLVEIKPFFAEMSVALGWKKFVLILDEIDVMIQHAEQQGNNEFNMLLSGLDSILDDAQVHQYVHFVLCGSNDLIRYQMNGGVLHQAFQRINALEVGNLPYQDIKAMLEQPCQKYDLKYDERAVDRIFRLTGGAVWYTRLMGTELVNKLSREHRSMVYPSDVCDCIPKVITSTNCKQFYEATLSGDKAVLNSLQRYTVHLDAGATAEEILQGIPGGMDDAALNASLELLQQLNLIRCVKSGNVVRYQFTIEMYRYFFRAQASASAQSDDEQFTPPPQESRDETDDFFANLDL